MRAEYGYTFKEIAEGLNSQVSGDDAGEALGKKGKESYSRQNIQYRYAKACKKLKKCIRNAGKIYRRG